MTSLPLYCIRTDAVLIHPGLPGFPITGAPTMCSAPDAPPASFVVATALAPIHWPTILSLWAIKQPRRAHIWPLRALLHLYLMLSLQHDIFLEPGPDLDTINSSREATYEALLDQTTHYVGNFWIRVPEMVLLALRRVKEPGIPNMLRALVTTAQQADAQHGTDTARSFAEQLITLITQLQTHVRENTLASINLTRRRVGIIERALHVAVHNAAPGVHKYLDDSATITARALALTPSLSGDKRIVASQKVALAETLGPALAALTKPASPTAIPHA